MASAIEQWESRTGDVSADRDGFGASREYVVTVDTVGQNADDVLRDPSDSTGVGTTAVPFGTPHPTRAGLFAAFYVVQQPRISSFVWRVRVIYAPPLTLQTQENPWEYSFSPGLATTTVRHDWFGRPIGPARYGQGLGPLPPGTKQYQVTIPSQGRGKPSETLILVREDAEDDAQVDDPAFLVDVSRTEPVGSFAMTRTFSNLNVNTVANIEMLGNIVNRTPFVGFAPGIVKFIGAPVNAGNGFVPDTGTQGFIWRTTLVFEWNSLGHRERRQDVFRHATGELPVVNEDGTPVIREWQLYPEGDLNVIPKLVEAFGSFIQPQRLGIQDGGQATPIPGGR